MRLFFDNCTSPVLADVLNAYLQPRRAAWHVRFMAEYGLDQASSDLDWISALSGHQPQEWIVLTSDDRIRRNRAERAAWKRARLRGFVLAKGYQKTPVNQQAALLLWRWP